MGDVAQILTGSSMASSSMYLNPGATSGGRKNDPTVAPPKAPPPPPPSHHPSRAFKMTSMSREVMELISGNQDKRSAALPPIVPAFPVTTIQKHEGQDFPASVKIGNKWISTSKPARKWVWAPFVSSSRTDGAMFRHWVRANVEYTEYPYARFDIHLDPVTYSDDEYSRYLQHDTWTRSETDQLMELARKFELRWPIIYDRWIEVYYDQRHVAAGPQRKIEDLQHRYYSVAAILSQSRIAQEAAAEVQALTTAASSATPGTASLAAPSAAPMDISATSASATTTPKATTSEALLMETAAARSLALSDPQHQPLIANIGTGTSNKVFDLQHERERRAHLDQIWHRNKEEEMEEEELRKELRMIDTQIRKVKKSGGHILAAANGGGGASVGAGSGTASALMSSAASSRNPSRSVTPVPPSSTNLSLVTSSSSSEPSALLLDQCFASTAPTPTPQTPYLQSGRLVPPAAGGPLGLSKSILSRMDTVLAELKVPPRPIPTKRVCDMYDAVRKDILTLLTLQKMALQKEGQLQSKRLRLAKIGGSVGKVVDEETLLGLPPAAAGTHLPPPNRGKNVVSTTAKNVKARTNVPGGSVGKKVATTKPGPTAAMTASIVGKQDDSTPVESSAAMIAAAAAVAAGVAPASLGPVAAVPGKMEIHETPGGKQVKKAAAIKRTKKKADSKSPNPAAALSMAPAVPTAPPAGSASLAPGPTVVTTAGVTAAAAAAAATGKGAAEVEAKSSGKKRPRKS